jgi:serine/threonine-protein kinase
LQPEALDLPLPDRPQRYELIRRLGRGGMGEVLLALSRGEHGFEKTIAIKRIRPELSRDPGFMDRFIAEAKTAVSLTHSNLVQVFDLARNQDELLLVMEYVDGPDLGRIMAALRKKRQRMSPRIALHIAGEALKGLVYAHEHASGGIVHCDITPSNILVSYAGEVKIADFGVAQERKRRRTGVFGKPGYIAPEHHTGGAVDGRADLFSLGVVVARALFGSNATPSFVVEQGPRLRPDVPAALISLLQRAMHEDPDVRPESARRMLAEVDGIARELGALLGPDLGAWVCDLVKPRANAQLAEGSEEVRSGRGRVTRSMILEPATLIRARDDTSPVEQTVNERPSQTAPDPSRETPQRSRSIAFVAAIGALLLVALGSWSLMSGTRSPVLPRPALGDVAAAPVHIATATAGAPLEASAQPQRPTETPPEPSHSQNLARAHAARSSRAPSKQAYGFLNIYAEPWAEVSIDGKTVGSTPLMKVKVAAGEHAITFRNPRFRALDKRCVVRQGATEIIDADLVASSP